MVTAAELLAGVTEVDKTLIISNDLRTIAIPSSIQNLGVESDDDVLKLNFKMPRYIGDVDLSTFSIRINYINAKAEGDIYTVNNPVIDDQYITFSWLVGPTATRYKGETKFNVCLKTLTSDGYVDQEFNTTVATMKVLEGLEVDGGSVKQYSDLIEQWRRELFGDSNSIKADTSWYEPGKSTFTLTTANQLYGLAQLVNDGIDFHDGTIKLGADIVINKGNAAMWNAETTGLYAWTPIGSSTTKCFRGVLDGQGHYISGLYSVKGRDNGFMSYTANATIKNLAIINSYFENNAVGSAKEGDAQVLGTFVGRGYGITLKNLYTDAILVCSAKDYHTGGIVGFAKSNDSKVNCGNSIIDSVIFAGVIDTTDITGSLVGGILGGTDFSHATVKNSLFVGTINSNDNNVGGIAGRLHEDSEIIGCVSAGIINNATGNNTTGSIVGQLYDFGSFSIIDCYYSDDMGLELVGCMADASLDDTGTEKLNPVQTTALRWWHVRN